MRQSVPRKIPADAMERMIKKNNPQFANPKKIADSGSDPWYMTPLGEKLLGNFAMGAPCCRRNPLINFSIIKNEHQDNMGLVMSRYGWYLEDLC